MPPHFLPLGGRRVLVTRAEARAGPLSRRLAALGAQPVEFPTVKVLPLRDPELLDAAILRLVDCQYDWIAFSSANGVEHFMRRLGEVGYDARAFAGTRIAIVGPATAAAVAAHGLLPDVLPTRSSSAGMLEAFAAHDLAERRVLVVRAASGREALAAGLRAHGAVVEEAAAYEVVPQAEGAVAVAEALRAGSIDVVTLTSGAIVHAFVHAMESAAGLPRVTLLALLRPPVVACLGRTAADACSELGIHVDLVAETPTMESLVQALVRAMA